MQEVDKIINQLDQVASKNLPQLEEVCKKNGIRSGHVLAAGGVVTSILLVLMHGYNIICALLTCVYPMIASIRAIESKDDKEKQNWLTFWCIFGIFQTVEMFIGFILAYIPYYYWVRLALFVYLMAPQTNGAMVCYEKVFKPFLTSHKSEIEEMISNVSSKASEAAADALAKSKKAANEMSSSENMMKAAAMAQQAKEQLNEDEPEKAEQLDKE